MKCLLLDCVDFSYKCVQKLNHGDDVEYPDQDKNYKNLAVAFISIEHKDTIKDVSYIVEILKQNENQLICIYPYIHLTSTPKSQKSAKQMFQRICEKVKSNNKLIIEIPFGWKKTFKINLSSKSNSELFYDSNNRQYKPSQTSKVTTIIKIIDKDMNDVQSTGLYEIFFSGGDSTPIVQTFADSLESTDVGSYILNPVAMSIINNIKQYITVALQSLGYCYEIKSPIILNFRPVSMKTYLQRFPARIYMIEDNEKSLGLRFAACANMFYWMKDKFIDYSHLPLGLYEFADCFRLQQTGEVRPLQRHRQFLMPDLHVFVPNERKKVIEQFLKLLQLTIQFTKDFEINRIIPVIRTSEEFYNTEKEFISEMLKIIEKDCVIELWQSAYYYFDLKYELNYITTNNKILQLSTVQLDSSNAKNYSIKYNNHPDVHTWTKNFENGPIIIHASLTGSIERVLRVIDETNKPEFIKPHKLLIIHIDRKREIDFLETCKFSIAEICIPAKALSKIIKNLRQQKFKTVSCFIILGDSEENLDIIELNFNDSKLKLNKKDVSIYLNEKYKTSFIYPYITFKL